MSVTPFSRLDDGRTLPHSLEAEKAVLGAILINPDAHPIAAAILIPGQFFRDAHRRIFDKQNRLAARGEAIDLITLKDELGRAGELEDVGGPAYLAALVDGLPRSTHIEHYANIIKEKAQLRSLIFTSTKTLNAAYDNSTDAADVIETAARDMDRLSADIRATTGLDVEALADATSVAAEGRAIQAAGVPYVVEGIVPAYGMLGMNVGYAKTGKTTLAQRLGAAVATGAPFLGRATAARRVLIIAAEDPPEYTAYLGRHLDLPDGAMTFYRRSIVLDGAGLQAILGTVRTGRYGLVLMSSWQAVVRGLVKDENDNAGAVHVVEAVKAAARTSGIPWLIDAHSGKGEDQGDTADPSKAMRGASGAAAAADYTLSLRYDNGPYGSRRRLSGKGRFVNFEPIVLDCDLTTGTYTAIGTTKTTTIETTWRLISETGALSSTPMTAGAIAFAAGLKVGATGKATADSRRQVAQALHGRDGIRTTTENRRGQLTTLYAKVEAE